MPILITWNVLSEGFRDRKKLAPFWKIFAQKYIVACVLSYCFHKIWKKNIDRCACKCQTAHYKTLKNLFYKKEFIIWWIKGDCRKCFKLF